MEDDSPEKRSLSLSGDALLRFLAGEVTQDQFNELLKVEFEQGLEESIITETNLTQLLLPKQESRSSEDENDDDEESDEDVPSPEKKKQAKPEKSTPARSEQSGPRLPKHLQGLLGEANIRFAQGDMEDATKICLELLREAPKIPEVHTLMAMIYDEQGDREKAFTFQLVSAHLGKHNVDQWVELAHTAKELDQLDRAIMCLDKAIKLRPGDLDLMQGRVDLLEAKGDRSKAVEGLEQMLNHIPDGKRYFELAGQIIREHHSNDEVARALSIFKKAFQTFPQSADMSDLNLLVELLMDQRKYQDALWALICHGEIEVQQEDGTLTTGTKELYRFNSITPVIINPQRCTIPPQLPIDLCAKVLICLILLGYDNCTQEALSILESEDAEEAGDLFIDVAEAFSDKGHHEKALPLLQRLVATQSYSLAGVWLKYAECLQSLEKLQEAAAAYTNVLALAPDHVGARVALSMLNQQMGQSEMALQILSQAPDDLGTSPNDPVDLELALPRCFLLHSHQWWRPFIKAARALLFGMFPRILQPKVVARLVTLELEKLKLSNMKNVLGPELFTEFRQVRAAFSEQSVVIKQKLWDLLLKLCEALLHEERYDELQCITIAAASHPIIDGHSERKNYLNLLTIQTCLVGGLGDHVFDFSRLVCLKNLYCNQAWNLFSQTLPISPTFRHNRFCLRLMFKYPDHSALALLNGHNALISGSYKYALAEYFSAFRCEPEDPFRSLCIALSFLHLASQKFVVNRHSLMIQGTTFLTQYQSLRGRSQETMYNFGRFYHQLGLYHAAIYYYEEALRCPPALGKPDGRYDLTMEIAYNLCLIYKLSGNNDLVHMVIQKCMVV